MSGGDERRERDALEERLEALGRRQRAEIPAALAREEREAEDRQLARLRAELLGDEDGERPGTAAPSATGPGGTRAVRVLVSLAAAALLLVLVAPLFQGLRTLWSSGFGGPTDPGPRMGAALELLAPEGPVGSFARFRWRAEVPAGGRLLLSVYDDSPAGGGRALVEDLDVAGDAWSPAPARLAEWPREIRWKLVLTDGTGGGRPIVAEARARRSE